MFDKLCDWIKANPIFFAIIVLLIVFGVWYMFWNEESYISYGAYKNRTM